MKKVYIFLIVSFLSTSGCESSNDKKVIGQIIGAAVGGYLGSKVGDGVTKDISVILGGAAGYILGGKIVQILNKTEQNEFNSVIEESLNNNPDNTSAKWTSSENETVSGQVTPLNKFERDKESCRDFKKIIKKNDEIFEETSTACRDKEGNWVLI